MKKTTLFICSIFLMALISLTGCAELIVQPALEKAKDSLNKNREIPMLSLGEEATYTFWGGILLSDSVDFKIKVKEAYWSDYYENPAIPPQARTPETRVRAEQKFLIVKVSVKNTANKALTFPKTSPPVFTLVDDKDAEYVVNNSAIYAQDNIMTKVVMGYNINPNMELKGELVFDVPKGNYVLIVSRGSNQGGFSVKREWDLAKYDLSPKGQVSEKKANVR